MQTTFRHFDLFETPRLSAGDVLPYCYHFAWFTPDNLAESQLSADGADPTFNAGEPYSRRMWAGGKLKWESNFIRIGQELREITQLLKAESKRSRDGRQMIVVTVRKQYFNEHGLTLTDDRSWLFRERADHADVKAATQTSSPMPESETIGEITASEITLFRYSALTFNSHRIHYDAEWCREVEGQPATVVHGPLNISLLANAHEGAFGQKPKILAYKALSPCFVNEEYKMMRNTVGDFWLQGQKGNIIMKIVGKE